MSDISTWEDTAAGNDKTPVPDFLPEGGTPIASVNNWAREAQAAIRRFYEAPEWRELGYTVAKSTDTAVAVQSGTTSSFGVGQRVRLTGGATMWATVTGISGDVILELDVDDGFPVSPLVDAIQLGVNAVGQPIHVSAVKDAQPLVVPTIADSVSLLNSDGELVSSDVPIAAALFEFDASDQLVRSQDINSQILTQIASTFAISSYSRSADGFIEFNVALGLGIMIQWGSDTASVEAAPFNPNFSDTPYAVVLQARGGNNISNYGHVDTKSASGFTWSIGGAVDFIDWIAIGPTTIIAAIAWPAAAAWYYDDTTTLASDQWYGLDFSPDGTKVYMCKNEGSSSIGQYTLNTPWDVTSKTGYTSNGTIAGSNSYGIRVRPDGSELWYSRSNTAVTQQIRVASLDTDYSIVGATVVATVNLLLLYPGIEVKGLYIKSDGTKLWVFN
ncbi:unnamed protein product, partial [marine sediment metagenome]